MIPLECGPIPTAPKDDARENNKNPDNGLSGPITAIDGTDRVRAVIFNNYVTLAFGFAMGNRDGWTSGRSSLVAGRL